MSTSSAVINAGGGIVLLGGGGRASQIMEALHESGTRGDVLGYLDDQPISIRMKKWNLSRLGPLSNARINHAQLLCCIGSPPTAELIVSGLELYGCEPFTLIHPAATISFGANLGAGSVALAGVRIGPFVESGPFTYFGTNSTVGHNTTLGSNCGVMTGTTVSGDCSIGDRVMVGISAAVLPGICVGDDARIGAGAVVTKDVEAGQTVVGIPARPVRNQAGDN